MASSSSSSYPSSSEMMNYARIGQIVVEVFRDILFQVLTHEIIPADLPKEVQNNIHKLGQLDTKIKTLLCLSTTIPSAEEFDVSSLYTMIRNLCKKVPAPSTKWGQSPLAGAITIGDDIERIREFRNNYGHATEAKIETQDFHKCCTDIKCLVSRFDTYFSSRVPPMKCDFDRKVDEILKRSMDNDILSEILRDLQKKMDDFHDSQKKMVDVVLDIQREQKEHVEDTKNIRRIIQENDKEKAGDKQKSKEKKYLVLDMPQGLEIKISIIKCYPDLKFALGKMDVMDIAEELFKKEKHKDVLEEIAKAETRRLKADQLLKRVLKLNENDLKIFYALLKRNCPERAQKLVEIKVTEKDRSDFKLVQESTEMDPPRTQSGIKFEKCDENFFKCDFRDRLERVDKRTDRLLSRFHISIFEHTQMIEIESPEDKIQVLLNKIQSCHFDSDSELKYVLGSKLYTKWQSSRHGLETKNIWHHLKKLKSLIKEHLIRHFGGLGLGFLRLKWSSLVLEFVTLDNFDMKLLKPDAVKTKVLEMIKTVCPEYQDIFTEPIHLAIFYKPSSNTEGAEVHFYLETGVEKEVCSCLKLEVRDINYMVEELDPASLSNWMMSKYQLNEDVKTELMDLVLSKEMSRRKKMKNLLSYVESLENGYELLEKYCEVHDTFVYNKVFQQRKQMMIQQNSDDAQQPKFPHEKTEGLQKLSCIWIDFLGDPKGIEQNTAHPVEVQDKVEGVSNSLIDEEHVRQLEKENSGDSNESSQRPKDKTGIVRQKEGRAILNYKVDSVSDSLIDERDARQMEKENIYLREPSQRTKDKTMLEGTKKGRATGHMQTEERAPLTPARKRPISSSQNELHSIKKPFQHSKYFSVNQHRNQQHRSFGVLIWVSVATLLSELTPLLSQLTPLILIVIVVIIAIIAIILLIWFRSRRNRH